MRPNCKNYTEPGGDKTVIGGTMEIKEGANVIGFPLAPATDSQLGGVKVGGGLAATADGTLSIAPATDSQLGGVKVGGGLAVTADGTLSIAPAAAVEDSDAAELANLVTAHNALLAALRDAGLIATE